MNVVNMKLTPVDVVVLGAGFSGALLSGLSTLSSDVHEFLVDQILAGQDPLVREQLEQTSILDRMCAPLCRALFASDDRRAGASFIEHITRSGLMAAAAALECREDDLLTATGQELRIDPAEDPERWPA